MAGKHKKKTGDHKTAGRAGVTGWLVRQALHWSPNHGTASSHHQLGLLQGWVSIAVNLFLFAAKGVLGLFTASLALLADAAHSFSDIGSSLIVVLGFYWARKPRDSKHPFGHGRIELVAALILSILLMVLAIEFARAGWARIQQPSLVYAPWWAIAAVAGTMLVKQWLSVFSLHLARATGSPAITADFWHHVSDVLSTGVVLIALVAARFGWSGVDGWAGLGVALFIFGTGIATAKSAISPLLGEAPSPEEVRAVEKAAMGVPGIQGVHDVIMHKYGEERLISFHIEVDAARSAMDVHDLSELVEDEVERVCGGKVIVHVDPVDRSHPDYGRTEQTMRDAVRQDQQLTEFHDLRVEGPSNRLHVSVDVVACMGTREQDFPDVEQRIRKAMREAMGAIATMDVRVESAYDGK